jgi:uncharacterized protein (UPF0128 family)
MHVAIQSINKNIHMHKNLYAHIKMNIIQAYITNACKSKDLFMTFINFSRIMHIHLLQVHDIYTIAKTLRSPRTYVPFT